MTRVFQPLFAIGLVCTTACSTAPLVAATKTPGPGVVARPADRPAIEPTAESPGSADPTGFSQQTTEALASASAHALGRHSPSTTALAQTNLPAGHMRTLLGADTANVTASTSTSTNNDDDAPSTGWFWGGAVVAGLGTVGLIAAGTVGYVHTRKVSDGYTNGMTHTELDDHVDAGQRANTLAATSAAVGLVGLLVAVTTYGVHYTRCGSLAHKRRDCAPKR